MYYVPTRYTLDIDTAKYEELSADSVKAAQNRLNQARIDYAFTIEVGARVASSFDLTNY